jgi:uroporphyrinogen-III decarboxylase
MGESAVGDCVGGTSVRETKMLSSRERLVAALRGEPPTLQAVAPLYLGLYLAGPRHEARARRWREQADKAGGMVEVTYASYLATELEVWWDGYRLFDELPDWLEAPTVPGPAGIEECTVEVTPDGCFWRSPNGLSRQLDAPFTNMAPPVWEAAGAPRTVGEVEALMPATTSGAVTGSGTYALAEQLVGDVGQTHALYWLTSAPYPAAYNLLGFSGLMTAMREGPQVVAAIAERSLANTLARAVAARNAGLDLVFVEEWACSGDLISPSDYLRFAWPFERGLCRELRRLGFGVVFYFCGPLKDRLGKLLELEADALAFEESKKNWVIDIGEVRRQVGAERCLFGNLDAVKVRGLPEARLTDEVHRLIDAGGPSAFVTSTGSPVTLDTPPRKLDIVMQAARSYS